MKNKKAEAVIKRLQDGNKLYSIQILGDRANKDYAFGILLNVGEFVAEKNEVFHGLSINTIELLKEAEIKFKVID